MSSGAAARNDRIPSPHVFKSEEQIMNILKPALRWIAAFALAVAVFTPGIASADLSITLDNPNSAISPYPGPYGTVLVQLLDATDAKVTLTATLGSNYLFGDGGTLGLNTNGTVSVSILSWVNGIGSSTPTVGNPGNEDGFGKFNVTIDNGQGAADALKTLSIQLTNTSGTWSSASDVLTPNSNGALAAGHVFVYTNSSYNGGTALATGFAAGSNGTPIINTPEPSTIALALSGLGAIGLVALRRRRGKTEEPRA
jgi:hypothetical protein